MLQCSRARGIGSGGIAEWIEGHAHISRRRTLKLSLNSNIPVLLAFKQEQFHLRHVLPRNSHSAERLRRGRKAAKPATIAAKHCQSLGNAHIRHGGRVTGTRPPA
jgi:hypothetical protein